MIATLIISLICFASITLSILFFPTIKIGRIKLSTYWIIALLGATILLIFSLAPINNVWEQLINEGEINPIKIIVLFFSMTLLSIFLDEVGLFRYLANLATKKANNSQKTLFIIFYILTSILTIFTSNDIVILTLTPFICFFCKNAKINPLPYLIGEFVAANTWSMFIIIGNPTNIYLASSANINFIDYFKVMALPTIGAGIIELIIIILLFNKQLRSPISIKEDNYKIENKIALIIGLIHLSICLLFLIISSYIHIQMWLITLISASSLIIFVLLLSAFKKDNFVLITTSFKRLPYPLLPFFLSMVVIVVAFNTQGISESIASFLNQGNIIFGYGYSSFLSANLINNIPMSILFESIISKNQLGAVYATIIGSNIGAFLTPLGALAGIMFSNLINKYDIHYSFLQFVKYGLIISLPTITVALSLLFLTLKS